MMSEQTHKKCFEYKVLELQITVHFNQLVELTVKGGIKRWQVTFFNNRGLFSNNRDRKWPRA